MTKLLNAVFNLRYLAILAIIAPFFGAALMFLLGVLDTFNAYLLFFGAVEPEGAIEPGEAAMVKLVASIDHFLFASVLIIFAIGLFALFFKTSSGNQENLRNRRRPSWNQLKNLGGMDEMLLKVIIMLLSVAFLEFLLTTGMNNLNWVVLVVPLSIIALAISLRWMQANSEQTELLPTESIPPTSPNTYLDELKQLSELLADGIITEDEFDNRKTQILGTQD